MKHIVEELISKQPASYEAAAGIAVRLFLQRNFTQIHMR